MEQLQAILVDPSETERTALAGLLGTTSFSFRTISTSALSEALALLDRGERALCVLGPGVPWREQSALFSSLCGHPAAAVIVVLDQAEVADFSRLLNLGIRGVIYKPYVQAGIAAVISEAVATLQDATATVSEEITSLPWLLETVARRLEDIAAKLRDEELTGQISATERKAFLHRILLQAVSAADTPALAPSDEVVEWLMQRLRSEK